MKTAVVIPNWNGDAYLRDCLESLIAQTVPLTIIVVDNGSTDGSLDMLHDYGDTIVLIQRDKNYGFTGGVNPGIEYAIKNSFDAVALFNNDATAKPDWLEKLQTELKDNVGIVACCLQTIDQKYIDSTGENMTTWGLPYPRGRHTPVESTPTEPEFIFGASGGASLYSVSMLREIGIFDQDFFAYYEDVDISFRAQLAGWKVKFTPKAVAYHRIGGTSSRLKDFTVYHTIKNMPMVVRKNVPKGLRLIVMPRFLLAYSSFIMMAVLRGQGAPALKGWFAYVKLIPKKNGERRRIQAAKKVSDEYILSLMTHDLPENSAKLRTLRSWWWKLRGKA